MIVIVGGGWSGLAAASELSRQGYPVTLLEAASHLGGRAASIKRHGLTLDAGQHLILGAYRQTIAVLTAAGISAHQAFQRQALELPIHGPEGDICFSLAPLPAPWHLLGGLLLTQGLSWRERLQVLRLTVALAVRTPAQDETVSALLQRYRQPPRLIAQLWQPLCLAIMNTPPEQASAQLFAQVMDAVFSKHRHDADMLIPKATLDELLAQPLARHIRAHDGKILLRQRVSSLEMDGQRIIAVATTTGERFAASAVILALPPVALQRLLAKQPASAALAASMAAIDYQPITTIYLQYPPAVALDGPMIGITSARIQWLFDRRYNGQPGLMAAVISGPGKHMALSTDELAQQVAAELARYFPSWPEPEWTVLLRDKRATFSATPDNQRLRPRHVTPLDNCLIAGDSAWKAYPATLEGAICSGLACARQLTDKMPAGGYSLPS